MRPPALSWLNDPIAGSMIRPSDNSPSSDYPQLLNKALKRPADALTTARGGSRLVVMTEATATPQPVLGDVDDFLAWVEGQRERYELVGGRLTPRAGGSEGHNDIQVNL